MQLIFRCLESSPAGLVVPDFQLAIIKMAPLYAMIISLWLNYLIVLELAKGEHTLE